MRSISETCVDINISNTELSKLVSKAKDWVFLKGLVMKSKENLNQDQVNIAPFLFLPTSFPKKEFFLAKEVQSLLNELIHKVAYNHKFLTKTLKSTVESDTGFTAKLFNIYQTIYAEGFSQVQQELAAPGVLEKFISDPIKIAKLKNIFMGLYSLDFNENGDKASAMAINNPEKYVLKPQREGGGNNFYNEDVKIKLESLKNSKDRTSYILMERIHAPLQKNIILRSNCEFKLQDCISELGIYGVIIGDKNKIFMNNQCGHILRTKPSNSDEGGIIFGAGAIDSPFLVD